MTLSPILLYAGGRATQGGESLPDPPPIQFVGSPNHWDGWAGHHPIAIVIHTMAGTLAGTDSTFNDPSVPDENRVSAHFGVALNGVTHQYVSLDDRAWANGILEDGNNWWDHTGVNPNSLTVSIETEDLAVNATPVSDELYKSVAGLVKMIVAKHPTITFLTSHHVISPKNRPNCCGKRWTAVETPGGVSRISQLAKSANLELRI